jgi:hypothetical protein
MKRDNNTLSAFREASPYAAPPRVLVMADDADAAGAVALAEALDAAGAETEVRFSVNPNRTDWNHVHSDAVVVAGSRGYWVSRHHPILESVLPVVA